MSQEILYTSAAAGLKRGSHGFCTVLSTDGMAGNIAEKLEALSGYRHAFPLHDPRSARNPINYSHLTIQMGGRRYHVLSRIAAAGLDYTQRNNKIAHHVALDESERVSAGPAALLATPQFCKTQWDGTPRIIPRRQAPVNPPENTGPCQAWNEATGDAGWAGVIAEHLLSEREKPISIIFPLGMDALRLTTEVLSLLPVDRRWGVTFSTYFTKLPAGLQCQLRFVLDGTQEAKALRRHPHVTLVDLAAKLGPAQGGALVEAARIVRRSAPPPVEHDAPPPPPRPNLPEPDRSEPVGSWADVSQSTKPAKPGSYALSMPGSRPPGARPPRKPGRLPVGARRKMSSRRRAALILVPLLLLGIGVYFALYRRGSPSEAEQSLAANDPDASGKDESVAPHPPGHLDVTPRNNGKEGPDGLPKTADKHSGTESTPKEGPKKTSLKQKQPTKNHRKPRLVENNPPPKKKPFADLPNPLDLPVARMQLGDQKPKTLAQVDWSFLSPKTPLSLVKLSIEYSEDGGNVLGLNGDSFKIAFDDEATPPAWTVYRSGGRGGISESRRRTVGRFTLVGSELKYTWDEQIRKNQGDRIVRYMRLRISVGDNEPVMRRLTKPESADPVPLVSKARKPRSPFEIPIKVPQALPPGEEVRQHLRLAVWVTGLKGGSGSTTRDRSVKIVMGEKRVPLYSFEMKQPLFDKSELIPTVKLVVVFKNGANGPALHLRRLAQAVVVKVKSNRLLPPDQQISTESSPKLTTLRGKGPDLSEFQWQQSNRAKAFRKKLADLYRRVAKDQSFDEWFKTYRLSLGQKPFVPIDMLRALRKDVRMKKAQKPKIKDALIQYLDSLLKLDAKLAHAQRIIRTYPQQRRFLEKHTEMLDKATIHYVLHLKIRKHPVVLVTTEKRAGK